MITAFEPPPELLRFVWDAASTSAATVNTSRRSDRTPEILPTQVLGPSKGRLVSLARRIMLQIIRRHVWIQRSPAGSWAGTGYLFISGIGTPRPAGTKPISTPMLGYLLGRDHSTFVLAMGYPGLSSLVEVAETALAGKYPPGTGFTAEVTFRGRANA